MNYELFGDYRNIALQYLNKKYNNTVLYSILEHDDKEILLLIEQSTISIIAHNDLFYKLIRMNIINE